MYPLKFLPFIKSAIWGGNPELCKYASEEVLEHYNSVGELWILSGYKDNESIIANGNLKGKNINEVIKTYGSLIIGEKYKKLWEDGFPLLIKIIGTMDNLSVQLHPNDEYAFKKEKSKGKTEAWYIIDCKSGSQIVDGVNIESKIELESMCRNGLLENYLSKRDVYPGEMYFVESGTVHGIGSGIVLLEVQQCSNVTYRLFDYDRGRMLHIEDGCNSYVQGRYCKNIEDGKLQCNYFSMEEILVEGEARLDDSSEILEVYVVIDGIVNLRYRVDEELRLLCGECVLVPPSIGRVSIIGQGKLIKITPYSLE